MPTPTDHLTVHFGGNRSGRADLTWAQRHIWDLCRVMSPNHHYFNQSRTLQLPAGHAVNDVAGAIRLLVERYEALRTTIHREPDGKPVQQVCAGGSLQLDIHEIGAGDGDSELEQLATDRRGQSFDDLEWPVRIAVLTRAGAPAYLLITASHVAVDRSGLDLVCEAFLRLLAGTGDDQPVTVHQPLDQAAAEDSPQARLVAKRALEYWRRTLLSVPPTILPTVASARKTPWGPAGYLRSEAVAMSAEALAAKHGVSASATVLAAAAALLGIRAGTGTVALQLIVANRFTPRQRELVSSCVQFGLFALDLRGASFHELLGRAGTGMLRAYRHAQYPWQDMAEVLDDVKLRRGIDIDLSSNFHDASGPVTAWHGSSDPQEIATAVERSEYRRGASFDRNQRLSLWMRRGPSSVLLGLTADPAYLSDKDVERLLRGVEALLVRAVHGDIELAEVPAITGVTPLDRPAGALDTATSQADGTGRPR